MQKLSRFATKAREINVRSLLVPGIFNISSEYTLDTMYTIHYNVVRTLQQLVETIRGGLSVPRSRERERERRGEAADRAALHGHASLPPGPCPFRSGRPLDPEEDAAPWRNTRVDNIFRVYSRQFSRGGVALIAVVHRGFASVPPSPSLPSSPLPPPPPLPPLSSTSSSSFVRLRFRPFSPSVLTAAIRRLFVPRREKRAAVRCYTLGSNLRTAGATRTNARCARREGVRRIFVFAHSRANAHPSSRDPPTRADCSPRRATRTRQTAAAVASSSRKTLFSLR